MFAKLSTEKGSSDDYHAIEKAKSKRTEVTELYFFYYNEKNQMNLARILLSIICIAFGLLTLIGYFIFIKPSSSAQSIDVVIALSFALAFIIGGLQTLRGIKYGIFIIFGACFLYLIAGIYNPIRLYGITGLTKIDIQFYYSFSFRVITSLILYYILKKLETYNDHKIT